MAEILKDYLNRWALIIFFDFDMKFSGHLLIWMPTLSLTNELFEKTRSIYKPYQEINFIKTLM